MPLQIEPPRAHRHAPSVLASQVRGHYPAATSGLHTPYTPAKVVPILAVEGLVKIYGKRRVVDGVSFHVDAGEVVGLLGPNGAGKTTSFRMACGLIKTNGGVVYLNGQDVTNFPMYRRSLDSGMGYLPQAESVFRNLSVQDNLLSVMELLGVPRPKQLARCEDLLEKFHLTHLRHNLGGGLSGGERRRLEIARALVSSPKIMLLDEPFANIDPITVHGIQDIIRQLSSDGIAILITDHQVRETLQITQRGYIIRSGQVLCHGTPEEILANDEARKVYFGNDVGVNEIVGGKKTPTHTKTHRPPLAPPTPPAAPPPPPPPRPQPRDIVLAQEATAVSAVPVSPPQGPHRAANVHDAGDALRDILRHGGKSPYQSDDAGRSETAPSPRPPRAPFHASHNSSGEHREHHHSAVLTAPAPPRVTHASPTHTHHTSHTPHHSSHHAARNATPSAASVSPPMYENLVPHATNSDAPSDNRLAFWERVHRFLWGW